MRARSYCFTINNYSEDDIDFLNKLDCKYLCYGLEIGESGTPHIQGFVVFNNAKSVKGIVKVLRGHIEVAKGNAKQNIDYCSKDGKFFERGDRPKQGKRSDIDRMKELVSEGAAMSEIVLEANSFQAVRYAEIAKYHLMKDRTEGPKVYWRFGKSGTGKTRWCFDNFDDVYIKDGTQWWNGYEQNECICIDDFDGHWPYRDLLRLLDRYPYQGQTKGGYVKINSPTIVITCEFPPSYFWSDNELLQVERRLFEIIEVFGTEVFGTEVGGNNKAPTSEFEFLHNN